MILAVTTYQKPLEEIDRYLTDHSAHLDRYYREKKIIFSGRRDPRIGGIILFNVPKMEEALSIIEKDPFKINGLAEYELFNFIPTKYDNDFASFIK